MRRVPTRLLGAWAVCFVTAASAASGGVSSVSYRESTDSFTWELRWDGDIPAAPEELVPPRAEGEAAGFWSPALKVSRTQAGNQLARFAFQARHGARVHPLDAPQGPGYKGVFVLGLRVGPSSDWIRLDRRQLVHLSTPKDTADAFDLLWRVEPGDGGGRAGRLILQGSHGAAGRAKKPPNPKKSK